MTEYERDLSQGNKPGKDDHGHQTSYVSQLFYIRISEAAYRHGFSGVPGLFFSYEISPMLVIQKETRQTLAHFLTDTLAIVGGVLTMAGLIVGPSLSYRLVRCG